MAFDCVVVDVGPLTDWSNCTIFVCQIYQYLVTTGMVATLVLHLSLGSVWFNSESYGHFQTNQSQLMIACSSMYGLKSHHHNAVACLDHMKASL